MASKLTLSLDPELIRFAHELARERGDSISNIVAAYFTALRKPPEQYRPRNAIIRDLYGSAQEIEIPKDKKSIRDELLRKHLK
jgi:hypothetical protein